jgi:cob(I)alamin adenosyltransferase
MGMDAESVPQSHGFLHVYTGDGKGKTTAAIGLAVRAAGAGQRVFFAQFLKGRPTSELAILSRLSDHITVQRYGGSEFVRNGGSEFDGSEAQRGLRAAQRAIQTGRYRLIILDEINLALATGLVDVDDVLALIEGVQSGTTLVLTGRYAPDLIIDAADLVTEMQEIKHYYHAGTEACIGIEM